MWGLVPYRPASKGSLVFERAMLSKLSQKTFRLQKIYSAFCSDTKSCSNTGTSKRICKICYFHSKGDLFDPQSFAKICNARIYPCSKSNGKGEFTLRGEVLDIFMPGEIFAHRINFDFDKIERIKHLRRKIRQHILK